MFKYILLTVALVSPSLGFEIACRIIGGTNATIQERPYIVSIQRNHTHHCGGTIISPVWIVSAAHCFYNDLRNLGPAATKKLISIRTGSTFHDHGGKIINPKEIIVHEKYNGPAVDYDIALIQLSKPIQAPARLIRLAAKGNPPSEGTMATLSGWGTMGIETELPLQLQTVDAPVINIDKCREALEFVTDKMFCVGEWSGSKTGCSGDSGGPVVANGKLIGVVSWGNPDCSLASVMTSISKFRDWIKKKSGI